MKIPPTFLKYLGLFFIVASLILWPVSMFTFAKEEPPVVLSLSWLAILLTGLAFYAASQDGEEIDSILSNLDKIMRKLKVK